MLIFLSYIVYALAQGILLNRFIVKEKVYPVLIVLIAAVFAPLVSITLVIGMIVVIIKYLATPKS